MSLLQPCPLCRQPLELCTCDPGEVIVAIRTQGSAVFACVDPERAWIDDLKASHTPAHGLDDSVPP